VVRSACNFRKDIVAVKIEFTGFVNKVKKFDWGTVYDMSHHQMTKNHQGEWEKSGTDYFSVTGPEGFVENDRVTVIGNLKTKRYERQDGSKGTSLNVRAESITMVEGVKRQSAAVMQQWPTAKIGKSQPVDESAPF
tara:strand:- start:702 stop:1109 length:408 start_codon:yes stop_codon:yes gene_type:complete